MAVAAWPAAAQAECSGRIRNADLNAEIAYDGFSPREAVAIKDIRIENTGNDDCAYWLAFYRTPAAPAMLGRQLVYEVRSLGGNELLSDRPPTAIPERFIATGSIRAGFSERIEYQWKVLRGQVTHAGSYADAVDLRLFEAGTNKLLDSRPLNLNAHVDAIVSINLAGADVSSAHTHTMDFGILQKGESKSIQVQIHSNQQFRLDVASTHGGRMQLPPPLESWSIDYTATLNGQLLRFPDSLGPFAATPVSGLSLPFRVTIGEVAQKRAGTYRDEITIAIVPAT